MHRVSPLVVNVGLKKSIAANFRLRRGSEDAAVGGVIDTEPGPALKIFLAFL